MSGSSITVLVIDDEPAVLETVQMVLRSYGWNVHGSSTGRQGVALTASLRPDIVLCDANMPDLSGTDLIKLLKTDAITMDVPIVLMTKFDNLDLSLPPHSIISLPKPFGPFELRHAMDLALGLRKRRSET